MRNIINPILLLLLFSNIVSAQEKKVITKAEDLPKHSYR